jgi:hypothetical protein
VREFLVGIAATNIHNSWRLDFTQKRLQDLTRAPINGKSISAQQKKKQQRREESLTKIAEWKSSIHAAKLRRQRRGGGFGAAGARAGLEWNRERVLPARWKRVDHKTGEMAGWEGPEDEGPPDWERIFDEDTDDDDDNDEDDDDDDDADERNEGNVEDDADGSTGNGIGDDDAKESGEEKENNGVANASGGAPKVARSGNNNNNDNNDNNSTCIAISNNNNKTSGGGGRSTGAGWWTHRDAQGVETSYFNLNQPLAVLPPVARRDNARAVIVALDALRTTPHAKRSEVAERLHERWLDVSYDCAL